MSESCDAWGACHRSNPREDALPRTCGGTLRCPVSTMSKSCDAWGACHRSNPRDCHGRRYGRSESPATRRAPQDVWRDTPMSRFDDVRVLRCLGRLSVVGTGDRSLPRQDALPMKCGGTLRCPVSTMSESCDAWGACHRSNPRDCHGRRYGRSESPATNKCPVTAPVRR